MIFNSDIFLFGFLPLVFLLFWTFKGKQQRYVILALSGYVFYGWWNWKFCFLLLFSSMVSYICGLKIQQSEKDWQRRRYLISAITIDLLLLGFFKYYNLFAHTLHGIFPPIAPPILNIILPIGISFYTFHTISYIVDVYCRRVRATNNLFEYLTYVSLFSQLVAGPIVRFRQIEDDLENIDGPPREEYIARGLGFFLVGMIKKVVVADSIAALINPLISQYGELSSGGAWAVMVGYTLQLYYDFSGYSDMAVGLGFLFGINIPQNFNSPYQAESITDFWRRWHISLSTWLRDYLYIPLGGNRKGVSRTYINLLITMLLGGLWHGANWTFVFWGAYHGLLLCLDRLFGPALQRLPVTLRRAGTLLLVMIGWVFFRSDNFGMASVWLSKLCFMGPGALGPSPALVAWCVGGLIAVSTIRETWDFKFGTTLKWAPAYALGLFITYLFMNGAESVFLYYQF